MERPVTPPDQVLRPNLTTPPPAPHRKRAVPRISGDIKDLPPPSYEANFNKPPDFEVPPLSGGDFQEFPNEEEWADKLGLKLPSGESIIAGRPDPSKLGPGAKLPSSIEALDRFLKEGDVDRMSLSGMSSTSARKSKPEAFVRWAEIQQEMADQSHLKPSFQGPKKSISGPGLMLPPPLKMLSGQQMKQTLKSSSEISNDPKEEAGIPQRQLKGAALLQEMADAEKPQQAEEGRAKVFMDRLPIVEATSRRFQGHLGMYADDTWPLPRVPENRNVFILETNAIKIRAALDDCSYFAVPTHRESGRSQYLDAKVKYSVMRVGTPAAQGPGITSFDDGKKASKAEASDTIAQMMEEGLEEGLKELEDEGKSEVPSTPKSLFHSVGSTSANNSSQNSQGSIIAAGENEELDAASQEIRSENTAERERRERWEELTSDPHFLGIGPAGPEYDAPATPDPDDGSDDNGATPEWVYRENATPDPHYDREGNEIPYDREGSLMSYNSSAARSDDEEMRTSTHENDSASAASQNSPGAPSPPSQALSTLIVYDSEVGVTQSMIDAVMAVSRAQDEGRSGETSPSIAETMSDSSEGIDEREGKEVSSTFNEQIENKQWILRHIRDARENARQGCLGEPMGLGRKKLDVVGSLHNHSLTFVQSKGRRLNPPVPQPDRMPGTLTAAICSYVPLKAKPILTLTLERVDAPISSPTQHRCILLKHFEVGLDGVESLCQGTAKIPETSEVAAEREKRVGKTGTFKQGEGGFYKALKCAQQKDQQYGKGYWYFFGVKFKQTSEEREAKMGGKWFLFGAPIEAVDHLDIKKTQENTDVVLGGGVDGSGTAIHPFMASFKRTHTLFSKGGIAPMDIWPGGDEWDDGVFGEIRVAMAHHGLRVGFLYARSFTPKPRGFPAAGKNQAGKKRKQAGPDMTEEEMEAMEKSLAPRRLSDEIGAKLVTKVVSDRAKADAASGSM